VTEQPHKRGPAPADTPADEPAPCDNDEQRGDADERSCPTGYPQQETARPQHPAPDSPTPRPEPTRKGD
jgi:hypothetical protein